MLKCVSSVTCFVRVAFLSLLPTGPSQGVSVVVALAALLINRCIIPVLPVAPVLPLAPVIITKRSMIMIHVKILMILIYAVTTVSDAGHSVGTESPGLRERHPDRNSGLFVLSPPVCARRRCPVRRRSSALRPHHRDARQPSLAVRV